MNNISISKNANINYLCKIAMLGKIRIHPNADRLFITTLDFQDVVIGQNMKENDIVVYFPVESSINANFLSFTNSYREKELNNDKTQTGFFEFNGRVKALRLRGEKSMGYVVPVKQVEDFTSKNISDCVGEQFDTVGETLLVKKYLVPTKEGGMSVKQGRKPRESRLIDGQVRLHVDTENLKQNAYKILPDDLISITYKVHGTSGWVANVLVKRKLSLLEKFLRKVGVNINDTEYDYVYGSRKVVKNPDMVDKKEFVHFYGTDIWGEVKDELKEFIPKGYTFYFEVVGYTKGGKAIQPQYDYGCEVGKRRVMIYRITFTNSDGLITELSTDDMMEWCKRVGLEYVHHFYTGTLRKMSMKLDDFSADKLLESEEELGLWAREFISELERRYTEKDCFMCKNAIPEEGIVLRKESLFQFETYKLKSFRFLELESKTLDAGQVDMESQ